MKIETILTPAELPALAQRDLRATACVVFDVLRAAISFSLCADKNESIFPRKKNFHPIVTAPLFHQRFCKIAQRDLSHGSNATTTHGPTKTLQTAAATTSEKW
jgi:hypothetical protein